MPLTRDEREFLDASVYETMHEPFTGPATQDLRQHDIYYSDLRWILTAYDRERCAERRPYPDRACLEPPPSPWGGERM
jgi:hypothetical protein